MARNCKLATKLRTFKSMWEMRRVPQPNVERRRSFNIDQNREEKLWVKIQGDETKEPKIWETKLGEKLQK